MSYKRKRKTKSAYNVLSKFTLLHWTTFIAVQRKEWPSGFQSNIMTDKHSLYHSKGMWISALDFSPIKCKDKTLRRWRQEDHKLENSLHCNVRPYLKNKIKHYRVCNED